ncbi:hypothetical protein ACSBR1_036551 [Camellia fascicularis]|uniref:Uncharacterized protein n=1 Tax=Camellia lanceoleosa TaxID=1840588 RepID=A0ACC0G7L2_9ERIC|nr:hypothetical protein LOK49_LG10G00719 [Camellia lanceoleosa]
MSAESESALIGAQLKLWISFTSVFFALCLQQLCCLYQQRTNLCFPTVSMRLRPKRTCSGVECFGGFHIKRFFFLFLFFRGPLT